MSTDEEQNEQPTADDSGPDSTSGDPDSTTRAETTDDDFRFSADDGVEEWAVGKTPREVYETAQSLAQTIQNAGANAPQAQNQPAQMNQSGQNVAAQQQQWNQAQQQMQNQGQSQPQRQGPSMPDPDLMYENPQEWQRQFQQAMQNQMNQSLQQAAGQFGQTVGQMARSVVAQEQDFSGVFSKWGHEVDQLLAENGVPPQSRTPDVYRRAAKMVKADHLDELVDELADQRVQSRSVTERPQQSGSDAAPAGGGDAIASFWHSDHDYAQNLKSKGLTQSDFRQTVRQMARKTGQAPADVVEMYKNNRVIASDKGMTTEDVAGMER